MTAADGTEAVAAYREHAGEIALVILDVLMPEVDGPATLAKLQGSDPTFGAAS